MFENFILNRLARRLKRCQVTTLSNGQLRNRTFTVQGKDMKPLHYIDFVAKQFPIIAVNGKFIEHRSRMREVYYKNGLKGLNLYIDYVRLRTRMEMKKQKNLPIKK